MNFDEAPKSVQDTILLTIDREKGVSNNPDDSGGLTKDGITAKVAKEYGYNDVLKMTDDQIKNLYLKIYYLKPNINLVGEVSETIAKELFDTGVNIGTKRPITWLQNNLNFLNNKQQYYNDIIVDGLLGKKTITALNALIAERGKDTVEKVLYNQLNALQGAYYYSLCSANQKYETFYFGWIRNRCDYII